MTFAHTERCVDELLSVLAAREVGGNMKRALFLVFVALWTLLGSAALPAYASASTRDGIVGDTKCGKSHNWSGKTDAQCVEACVKGKESYALVVGDQVYTLAGKPVTIAPFACKHVQVKGTITALGLTVISIHEMR